MKKAISASLALAAAIALTACASGETKEPPQTESTSYAQESSSFTAKPVQQEPQPVEELPSYQEMVEGVDGFVGNKYKVAGRVTHVGGGFRGDDYMVYVYWDDSETYGEVATVRIKYDNYTKSVSKYFEGTCTLEGLDDDGHPQFVCNAYFVEQQ